MAPVAAKFKRIDFYKKLPSDFVEGTLAGAWISMLAAVLIGMLLLLELSSFMALQKDEELVIDNSPEGDLLKISFNISFPYVTCELATVDVSDALGKKRMNLTKTIHKTPVDANLVRQGWTEQEKARIQPKYDRDYAWWQHVDISTPLDKKEFAATLHRYPLVVVNFYAPWCPFCRRMEPSWEAATQAVHDKYPEESDGRIRFAKVDCTKEQQLCKDHFVTAFPSIRVFRKAHDDVMVNGQHTHEAYTGDRTKEAFEQFADSLVPSAGQPQLKHAQLKSAPKASGCNVAGFVLVKKVPGSIHFMDHADFFSFGLTGIDLTHTIHWFYFGARPSPNGYYQLQRLHPMGLHPDWLDKLKGRTFSSESLEHTHEHYLKVVRTTVEPLNGRHPGVHYDAYEYLANHHSYKRDEHPTVKITYNLSPLQVVVRELPKAWYKFLTTTCAVVGGVFTVAGILDSILHTGLSAVKKKVEIGKFT